MFSHCARISMEDLDALKLDPEQDEQYQNLQLQIDNHTEEMDNIEVDPYRNVTSRRR